MMQSHETSRSRTSVDVPPIASTSNVEREEMKCQTELEQVLLELTREEAVLEATLSQALNDLSACSEGELPREELVGSERMMAILEQEYADLSATLEVLNKTTPLNSSITLSQSTQSQLVIIECDKQNKTVVKELEIALEWEEKRNKIESRKMERDKILVSDAVTLNELLGKKYLELEQAICLGLEGEKLISETKSKAAALDIKSDKLIKAINDFIDLRLNVDEPDENLPERNSIAQVSKARKEKSKSIHSETEELDIRTYFKQARDKSIAHPESDILDPAALLKLLLEVLILQAIYNPSSPYIKLPINSPTRSGKEGIEVPIEITNFLLRAGIILEHPREKSKIRLVDFGSNFTATLEEEEW